MSIDVVGLGGQWYLTVSTVEADTILDPIDDPYVAAQLGLRSPRCLSCRDLGGG